MREAKNSPDSGLITLAANLRIVVLSATCLACPNALLVPCPECRLCAHHRCPQRRASSSSWCKFQDLMLNLAKIGPSRLLLYQCRICRRGVDRPHVAMCLDVSSCLR